MKTLRFSCVCFTTSYEHIVKEIAMIIAMLSGSYNFLYFFPFFYFGS
jgi:hypothetical protein